MDRRERSSHTGLPVRKHLEFRRNPADEGDPAEDSPGRIGIAMGLAQRRSPRVVGQLQPLLVDHLGEKVVEVVFLGG